MLVVDMLQLRGVHRLIVRSNEGEDDGDKGCDAEGNTQGRVNGSRRKLQSRQVRIRMKKKKDTTPGERY